MYLENRHPDYGQALDPADADALGVAGADEVERYLASRPDHRPTPLHALPALAAEAGVAAIHLKDEGRRLGLGSFKALGGAYAVIRLVREEAGRRLGRPVGYADPSRPGGARGRPGPDVRLCHRRQSRPLGRGGCAGVGAKAAIFVHGEVSEDRVAAIARYGGRSSVSPEPTSNWWKRPRGSARRVGGPSSPIRRGPATSAFPLPGHAGLHGDTERGAPRELERTANPRVRAGGRRRRRGRGRGPSRARARRPAADLRGGRSGASGLPLRDRAGRASGQDRTRRADRDGDARMLRALAGRLARAGARRRRLHDRRGGGCDRGDEPARASRRERSRDRGGRERRRRPRRSLPRGSDTGDPSDARSQRRVPRPRHQHRRRDRSAALPGAGRPRGAAIVLA